MRARLLLSLALLVGCAEKLPESHVLPVVEAERAFSRLSVERGTKAAFLANLAADAVVFTPGPTAARAYYDSEPDVGSRLSWKPGYAEISRAGDLGFTTGLYTSTRADGEMRFGHYASVWRKQADGRWKVVADGGNHHAPPLQVAEELAFFPAPKATRKKPPQVVVAAERTRLLAAEGILLAAWRQVGTAALLAHATDDVRYLPPDALPVVGRTAVQTALAGRRDELSFEPAGGDLASSGDLGYTYGALTHKPGPSAPARPGGYLRVWRRSARGVWQVVLELHAVPPTSGPQPTGAAANAARASEPIDDPPASDAPGE
jgi:ketosteroid isomerase-like protein